MELSGIDIIGIGVELPSSELELDCLKGFCTGVRIELELLLSELELNGKNGITRCQHLHCLTFNLVLLAKGYKLYFCDFLTQLMR